MVNGQSGINSSRFRKKTLCASPFQRRLNQRRYGGEANPPRNEFTYRDLVRGIQHGGRSPTCFQGAPRQSECRKPVQVRSLKGELMQCSKSSLAAGPSIRRGHARQWAIGIRMSGDPSCATTEPSRNSTSPCTTDCGWTSTSISSELSENRWCASMISSPLFMSVAESIVTFGPITQFG